MPQWLIQLAADTHFPPLPPLPATPDADILTHEHPTTAAAFS
jgi:hypothetical protein